MDLQLEDLELYKLLRSRKSDKVATALAGILQAITSDARAHLEFIKNNFPSYTDHGIQHSFRIVHRIGQLLSPAARKELSSVEIFAFLFAAMFHDAGMVADDQLSPNKVRDEHARRSGELIERYLKERLNLFSEVHHRLKRLLTFVVESHGMTWEQMTARAEFQRPDTILNGIVRPNLLAILLRIGDLLDLDYERSQDAVRRCNPGFFKDKTSQLHHDRHVKVMNLHITPESIQVSVESHSEAADNIWEKWFGYLRQDIERANTRVFRGPLEKFHLPSHDLTIDSVWKIPALEFGDFSKALDHAVDTSQGRVEVLASIGDGDFTNTWLRRLRTGAPTKIERVHVRCLADAVIEEVFKDSGGRDPFKESLDRNLKNLRQLCEQRKIELIIRPWLAPAPFHGFICGEHALVGEWTRDEKGVPTAVTPLKHIQRSRHPTEFAGYLKKFDQP